MLHIRRILVPVDFSEQCSRALAYARELAVIHSADLDVLHVIEEPAFPAFYTLGEEAMTGDVQGLRERAEEALTDCMDEAVGPELAKEVGFHIEKGKPGEKIIELADDQDIDLIVIASHGMSGIERFLMGSVAEKVVRNAKCPVFVVKSFGKSLLSEGGG